MYCHVKMACMSWCARDHKSASAASSDMHGILPNVPAQPQYVGLIVGVIIMWFREMGFIGKLAMFSLFMYWNSDRSKSSIGVRRQAVQLLGSYTSHSIP